MQRDKLLKEFIVLTLFMFRCIIDGTKRQSKELFWMFISFHYFTYFQESECEYCCSNSNVFAIVKTINQHSALY